jgi:uncharacterized protein (DUF427 family)
MASAETGRLLTHFRNAVLHVEPSPRWIRGFIGGTAVVDSKRAILVRSQAPRRGRPVYYFPQEDVRMDVLEPSGTVTNDRHIGDASYYNLRLGDRLEEDAAWTFGEPFAGEDAERDDAPDLRGYVAFVWGKLDSWFEEGEEIFAHPRDPYKRVDCIPSTRHVKVVLGGEVVAETDRPVLLFETGLRARYYIPKIDVRMDLLRHSDTHTVCPYKGTASYYSVEAGGKVYEDIAWYYPQALPESMRIAGGYVAFYDEKVDAFEVD